LALLAACASYAPSVPAGYAGPTAQLRETGFMQGKTTGHLFYVASIDGKDVYSSYTQTRKEQQGKGMALRLSFVSHTLPASPMRLKLVGRTVGGAPISELVAMGGGRNFDVTREVTFTPQPDGLYVVIGKLQAEGADVWIQDGRTGERVSR
jgi:hypothetical protein